jgi:hypothetical protein
MKLARIILAAMFLASAAVSATAADKVIPAADGEALIVPRDSPVRFQRFDKYGGAHFSGRFVLSGSFTYGCTYDCDGPLTEDNLALHFVPDPELVKRLPHWRQHTNDMRIYIDRAAPFGQAVAVQRAAILKGDLGEVTGRASIVVDEFTMTLECDSASFTARFVKFEEPAALQEVRLAGDYGCV